MATYAFRLFAIALCGAVLSFPVYGQTRTEDVKLDPSDPPGPPPDDLNLFFGWRVALDGDFAVVGAPRERRNRFTPEEIRDEGAAYVYRRNTPADPCPVSTDDWCEEAKLTPAFTSETYRRIRLGSNVAISGDTIIAGASRDRAFGSNSGAAFAYRRDPTLAVCGDLWCSEGKLLASDGAPFDFFANNVAVDGDTAFISSNSGSIGGVYIFTRSGTTWTEQVKLTPPTNDLGQAFGNNIALDGDTLLVGASGDSTPIMGDPTDFTSAGAAHVYTNVAGTWTYHSKLQASDRRAQDQFGTGVAVSGDKAVIGAPRRIGGMCEGGAAYVFELVGGVWQEQTKILSPNGTADDCYAFLVAVSGNTVIVPADLEDSPGMDAGAAYLYTGAGPSWTLTSRMAPLNVQANDAFGWSVSLQGNTAVLGAPISPFSGVDLPGTAYVFELDQAETPVGDDVEVNPIPLDENGDPAPNGPPMSLQFTEVTDSGNTTVEISDTAPPLPDGFRVGGLSGESAFFNIQTEAEFVPPVEICIDYSTLALEGDPADLVFAHEESGVWVDITTSNDIVAMVICGETNTFSFFAVLGQPSADSLLTELSDALEELNAGNGTINGLMSKLAAAQAKLNDGNPNNDHAAVNMLNAFVNAAQAQRGKKLTDSEADMLIDAANEVIHVIEGVSL